MNEIDSGFTYGKTEQRDTQDYMQLQLQATNSQTNSQLQKTYTVVEFTYGDFPCYLNVNREKTPSSYHPWKCKKGERLTITTNSFMKIYQLDRFCPLWQSG